MPPSRKSRTNSHHCPGARLDGKCRWSKTPPRYCKTHQELCGPHQWVHLKNEPCWYCSTLQTCGRHPGVEHPRAEDCPSCVAEQAAAAAAAANPAPAAAAVTNPNTCPYKEWGQCRWKKRLQYCTNHQAKCSMHYEIYDNNYGCQSCQAGG